jgi:hypothetical protein
MTKILVFIHRKSQFILVTAHFKIGQAYLDARCYDQALEHLTLSLKINSNLVHEVE